MGLSRETKGAPLRRVSACPDPCFEVESGMVVYDVVSVSLLM